MKQLGKLAKAYCVERGKHFKLKDFDPADTGGIRSKERAAAALQKSLEQLANLQDKLYAQDQWAVLLIFQGIDASGKDGVIKHVMAGVNPMGCQAYSFKAPSSEEQQHDYLWRTMQRIPERRRIGIFNRSYYEEVLVTRVHPELLEAQRLPPEPSGTELWKARYKQIRRFEHYLNDNGFVVRKFMLHVSREEQARRLLERVRGLGPDDLVLALISGGGSALLTLPAPGLTLADKQAVNRALLASGATIGEMNAVRKHLSAIKGGRLAAAAAPAQVVTLAISDVPGDDLAVIASGPTVPDPTTFAKARALLARYGITPPQAVAAHLAAAADETPKLGSLPHASFRLIATPMMALARAAEVAHDLGLAPLILGDALEGEAREMGTLMAGIARSVRAHATPLPAPAAGLVLTPGHSAPARLPASMAS